MLVTLGALNVSSNIVAQTNCSVLRFVVEDAALHLSDRVSYGTVNLQRDYVCVLDVDLLELSLRWAIRRVRTQDWKPLSNDLGGDDFFT